LFRFGKKFFKGKIEMKGEKGFLKTLQEEIGKSGQV